MTSDAWDHAPGPEDDPFFQPLWDSAEDAPARRPGPARPDALHPGLDLAALLGPLCEAQDALARLDARAEVAPAPVLEGLVHRMALAEAAGWLSHAYMWVHPLDLALRELDLIGGTALALAQDGSRSLPHTFGLRRQAWEERTPYQIAFGDRAITDALALVRVLRADARRRRGLFASQDAARKTLAAFGAPDLDDARFGQWLADRKPPPKRQTAPILPPLLRAGLAAQAWMEAGIVDLPTPLQAGLAAGWLVARDGPLRQVPLPLWAVCPVLGHGPSEGLPGLRSDIGRSGSWIAAFLRLATDGALAGSRELAGLLAVAERGEALTANADRRSRLRDAMGEVLRQPIVTPKALAGRLKVVPQTATALLHDLEQAGLVREVTGRRSFRAFAAAVAG